MHDLTVFFLPVNPLDRRRPTIRLDSPHAGGDGSLTIIIESIEKLRENRASAAATRKIPTTVLRAPRRGATSMSARPPTRTSANGSQCKRQARSAPSPACGGGLGRGSNKMIYHVACPPPVRPPPPASGGGDGVALLVVVAPAMVHSQAGPATRGPCGSAGCRRDPRPRSGRPASRYRRDCRTRLRRSCAGFSA